MKGCRDKRAWAIEGLSIWVKRLDHDRVCSKWPDTEVWLAELPRPGHLQHSQFIPTVNRPWNLKGQGHFKHENTINFSKDPFGKENDLHSNWNNAISSNFLAEWDQFCKYMNSGPLYITLNGMSSYRSHNPELVGRWRPILITQLTDCQSVHTVPTLCSGCWWFLQNARHRPAIGPWLTVCLPEVGKVICSVLKLPLFFYFSRLWGQPNW